jgi:surface antigen
MLAGAALGGLAGNQFGKGSGRAWATGAGVLLGGLLGSEVGKSMDKTDRLYMEQQTNRALETAPINQQSTWRNPDTGNNGYITPRRTYQNPDGRYCREFSQTINIGQRREEATGTACRNPDGTWQIVS